MDDLLDLNRRIAEHWLGKLDAKQEAYLRYASTCVACLTHDASAFVSFLAGPRHKHGNALPIANLNRHYLEFATVAGQEVTDGKLEMLLRLAISMREAEILARLTSDELNRISDGWLGLVIQLRSAALSRGLALHAPAGRLHAASLVTIRD